MAGRITKTRPRRIASGVQPFFADDFAGGQLNPANGFTYTPLGANVSLSTEQAHSGTHSVKVLYPASAAADSNQGTGYELRFDMGRYVGEIWIDYWLYLPSNFAHRYTALHTVNNKFLLLWRDNYFDDAGDTTLLVGQEFEYGGALGGYPNLNPGGSYQRVYATTRTPSGIAVLDRAKDGGGVAANFLGGSNGAALVGQWNRFRVHWKPSSAAGVLDGVMESWVNDTKICTITGADFWNNVDDAATDVKFRDGYFMGSSDSGYDVDTAFYLDDLKFYDTDPGWSVTQTVFAAHDFSDGTTGSFTATQTNGTLSYPTVSGYNGGSRVARCTGGTSTTTGEVSIDTTFLESQTRDGGQIHVAWAQRFTAGTLAQAAASGGAEVERQIKTFLARATGSDNWIQAITGYTAYGINRIGYAQDFGTSFLPPGTLTPEGGRFTTTDDGIWQVHQFQFRKTSPTYGLVRTWADDVEVGTESAGAEPGRFGHQSDAAAIHTIRIGLTYFRRYSGDTALETDIGKIVVSNYRLTLAQFNAQGNV